MDKLVTVSVRIPEQAATELTTLARQQGSWRPRLLKRIIAQYIENNRPEATATVDGKKPTQADELVGEFLDWCAVERNLAKATVASYRVDLRSLLHLYHDESDKPLADWFSTVTIGKFLRSLARRGASAQTIRRHLASVRMLCRYLMLTERMQSNPALAILTPRQKHTLPTVLAPKEVERLLAAPKESDPIGRRDRAILTLVYSAGLRCQELTQLRVVDINFDDKEVRCMGKGARERILPLSDRAAKAIRAYVEQDRPTTGQDTLFLSYRPPRRHHKEKYKKLWENLPREELKDNVYNAIARGGAVTDRGRRDFGGR